MPKEVVSAGVSMGAYSPAVIAGGFCYLAGQGGVDPETRTVVEGGIRPETEQALRNIQAILEAAGYTLSDCVNVTCFLADMSEWDTMNEVYAEFFPSDPPARTAVAVRELPAGIRVELQAVAWRDPAAANRGAG
jgi:2-iminobutanoate/2-iminopropanoate deaminase